jgi:hypothetical protein
MVHLVQTVHLSSTETNTISERNKTSFHLSLVTQEYHPVHPKQFLSLWYVWRKPCTYHAPKLTLSLKGSKWDSTWPTSPRSSIGCVQNGFWSYGTFGANCGPILHRYKHYIQMDQNEILHDPRHLGVPSGASKNISELTVRSSQTIHLSWVKISTISKLTETSFHLSLVTLEYHPVRPKWFLGLWYIWCKPCTYLALKLTLSLNGPKQASIWASSPRSTIRCIQNNFWAYGTFRANRAPIMHQN